MDIDQQQLEKARVFAYFGFAGLMFPVVGFISGCVSISILNRLVLDKKDIEGLGEHERIMTLAHAACATSVVLAALMVFGTIFAINQAVEAQNNNSVNEYYQRTLDAIDKD